MKLFVLSLLFACLDVTTCWSEEWAPPPQEFEQIALHLGNCISDAVTAEAPACIDKATQAWEGLLQKEYDKLMDRLLPPRQKLLRDSQTEWLRFKYFELKRIDDFYGETKGTKVAIARSQAVNALVRERAISMRIASAALDGTYMDDWWYPLFREH